MNRRGSIFLNIDWFTVILYLVMVVLGWLSIFSAVYSAEHPSILDFNQRYGKQFLWIIAAIVLAVTVMLVDHRFYNFFAYFIYGFIILLLIFVLIAGKEINGARSWFAIGSFQIQPSEFAKPATVLALAKYLSGFNVNAQNFRTFIKSMGIILLPSVIILMQPDTGSAIVFFALILAIYREGFSPIILFIIVSLIILFFMVILVDPFLVLIILAGLSLMAWGYISGSIASFGKAALIYAGAFGFFYLISMLTSWENPLFRVALFSMILTSVIFLVVIFMKRIKKASIIVLAVLAALVYTSAIDYGYHNILGDHQQRRINIMLGLETDLHGAGYNLNQSKIAIGSGGFLGKGFLMGTQTKLHFVPEQSTDFIFCTVGEEWGFIGSIVVIGLFSVLLIRLIQLAERQRSAFARVYGYGLFSIVFFHFFVNIAMTIGLFPVIGIPLPFFSYGGSSLWAFTILLFIFLKLDAVRMEFNH